MTDIEERAHKATARFLNSKGYAILEENYHGEWSDVDIPFVATETDDDGDLVVVFVLVSVCSFEEWPPVIESDKKFLEKVEICMSEWTIDNEDKLPEQLGLGSMRLDGIGILMENEDNHRAMLRHHKSITSELV